MLFESQLYYRNKFSMNFLRCTGFPVTASVPEVEWVFYLHKSTFSTIRNSFSYKEGTEKDVAESFFWSLNCYYFASRSYFHINQILALF